MQDSQSHTSEQLWQSSFAKAWPWMQVNTPEILDIPDIHVRGCSMPCLTMVSLAAVKFQPKGTKPSCMRCTFLAAERNNEKRKAVTSCDSMWLDDFLKAENNEKGRQTRTSLFGSISEIHIPYTSKKNKQKNMLPMWTGDFAIINLCWVIFAQQDFPLRPSSPPPGREKDQLHPRVLPESSVPCDWATQALSKLSKSMLSPQSTVLAIAHSN